MDLRIIIKILETAMSINKILKPKNKRLRKNFLPIVKQIILKKQRNRCNWCDKLLIHPNFDHIDRNRTNNHISNCQALCPNCHAMKTRTRR